MLQETRLNDRRKFLNRRKDFKIKNNLLNLKGNNETVINNLYKEIREIEAQWNERKKVIFNKNNSSQIGEIEDLFDQDFNIKVGKNSCQTSCLSDSEKSPWLLNQGLFDMKNEIKDINYTNNNISEDISHRTWWLGFLSSLDYLTDYIMKHMYQR